MWVRRPDDEIAELDRQQEEEARGRLKPLLLALLLTIVCVAFYVVGFRGYYQGVILAEPRAPVSLGRILVYGLVMLPIFYWFCRRDAKQRGLSAFAGPSALICDRCHEPQAGAEGDPCDCGGALELLERWQWVDDESDDEEDDSPTGE